MLFYRGRGNSVTKKLDLHSVSVSESYRHSVSRTRIMAHEQEYVARTSLRSP